MSYFYNYIFLATGDPEIDEEYIEIPLKLEALYIFERKNIDPFTLKTFAEYIFSDVFEKM